MRSVAWAMGWELWRRFRVFFVLAAAYPPVAAVVLRFLPGGELGEAIALLAVAPSAVAGVLLLVIFTYSWRTDLIILVGFAIVWVVKTYLPSSQQVSSVVGSPTISASFINRVLTRYNSPASGKGQALYNYGVKYGIDPAFALAFFLEESTFGTQGVARETHSLGNIRAVPGYPQVDGYRYYRTWEEGFEDWYKLISQQYVTQWGLSTVDQIIPVYAPGSDNNDEAAYIQTVKSAVSTWRSGQVDV